MTCEYLIGIAALFAPAFGLAQGYTITTVAGGGSGIGDGIPATNAFASPSGVAVDAAGNVYFSDLGGALIRRINPDGTISTLAGTFASSGYSGDGSPAIGAQLDHPYGIAIDAVGNLYIADWANNRIRKVDTNGIITTVAGGGSNFLNFGDGGPATAAILLMPQGVALDAAGNSDRSG